MSARVRGLRIRSLAALLVMASMTATILVSCEAFFNAIFDTGAPGSLSASDGKYADRIEVSWSAPNLSSEKWQGSKVTGYTISWEGPISDSEVVPASRTSYTIYVNNPDHRAQEYNITVTSKIDNTDAGSSSDTGFALETFDLLWEDGGSTYNFDGADRWYVTMLQKGFRYDFEFADEGQSGRIEFYKHGTLDILHDTGDTAPVGPKTLSSWVCSEKGDWHKFYVRVVPSVAGDTSFRASYGF